MSIQPLKFETSTGEVLEIPYLADMFTYKQMKKFNKQSTVDGVFDPELLQDLVIQALPKETREIVENLSMRDFPAFMAQWNEAEELGESSSS